MKKMYPVVMALFALTACDGGLVVPEACNTLPDLSLYVGESEQVMPCFIGDAALTYSVVSANPEVADAVIRNDRVTVLARSPGEASVTITANNGEAMGEQRFTVIVPNRDPVVVDPPAPLRMIPGSSRVVDLSPVFADPDEQDLQYSATSSNPMVVTASISDLSLRIESLSGGDAGVFVTATDGDASVSVTIDVSVVPIETLYEDEFSGGLGDWCKQAGGKCNQTNPGLRVQDGYLETWGVNDDASIALRSMAADQFDIRARVRTGGDSTSVVIGVITTDPIWVQMEVNIQTFTEDDFAVYLYNGQTKVLHRMASGSFGLESREEWTDLRLYYADDQYHVQFNDGDPVSFGDAASTSSGITTLALIAEHYAVSEAKVDHRVQMDRITVKGVGSSADYLSSSKLSWRRK